MPAHQDRKSFPLASALGLFAVGFLVLAWPWLSGAVTIPYDAKSQFFPQLTFLARSLAEGQSPFWTPNVFAGWPQIADPQSLIFSPFHFILALFNPTPSFFAADAVVFALLFTGGVGIILIFRERRWHVAGAVVAGLAFAFGGSNASRLQHIGQIESLVFLMWALLMLMRALERSSWWVGAAFGVFAALIVLGRNQVSLLGIYLLMGFVLWHWLDGEGRLVRLRASVMPLVVGTVAGALITAVPVLLTELLAVNSNRPEIGYFIAGRGSLHPAYFLMLVFGNLYRASDFQYEYWGPPSFPWHEVFGSTDLYLAQNAGQIYCGALVAVTVLGFGMVRGLLWSRGIRFFTIALALMVLYSLGKYTPALRVMHELPGVSLFRRPADGSFLIGALLALTAGYLVHRWLSGTVPGWARWHRWADLALALALTVAALVLAFWIGQLQSAIAPIVVGLLLLAGAIGALILARRLDGRSPLAAAALLAVFSTVDLAWTNAPNESTGLPPAVYEALRFDTKDETIALLKTRLAATAAPDRRDRVELIGIAYHWPNLGLVHNFEHLFGHNPLRSRDFFRATAAHDTVAISDQRQFTPLLPSYRSNLENLFGVRFIAAGIPVEQIDKSLKPGDLTLIARTKDAYVYENPRALPRVLLAGNWVITAFERMIADGRWPDGWTSSSVLLERAPRPAFPPSAKKTGAARIISYRNTEVVVEVETSASTMLVLNDVWHPWWRATLDGTPVEILKANVLFRGVAVPPGKHTVRFTFHPLAGAMAEIGERLSALLR